MYMAQLAKRNLWHGSALLRILKMRQKFSWMFLWSSWEKNLRTQIIIISIVRIKNVCKFSPSSSVKYQKVNINHLKTWRNILFLVKISVTSIFICRTLLGKLFFRTLVLNFSLNFYNCFSPYLYWRHWFCVFLNLFFYWENSGLAREKWSSDTGLIHFSHS